MSFCSGVKHPMTQKQRGGNHGVFAITEIWNLIQTFSFSLQSSKQTLCHLLSVFLFIFSVKIDEAYSTTSLPTVMSIEIVGTSIHYVLLLGGEAPALLLGHKARPGLHRAGATER